jgi:hypothetical protein
MGVNMRTTTFMSDDYKIRVTEMAGNTLKFSFVYTETLEDPTGVKPTTIEVDIDRVVYDAFETLHAKLLKAKQRIRELELERGL